MRKILIYDFTNAKKSWNEIMSKNDDDKKGLKGIANHTQFLIDCLEKRLLVDLPTDENSTHSQYVIAVLQKYNNNKDFLTTIIY